MSFKRALIVHAYSARNAGDAAIVIATADLLRGLGIESVAVASKHAGRDREFYADYGLMVHDAVIEFPTRGSGSETRRLASLVGGMATVAGAAALLQIPGLGARLRSRLSNRSEGIGLLLHYDTVVLCGGGYLYSSKNPLSLTLFYTSVLNRIASMVSRRVIMMPQSIGPMTRYRDLLVTGEGLRRIVPVVVRDEESVAVLTRMPQRLSPPVICPDVVFAMEAGTSQDRGGAAFGVGIVVMDWRWAIPHSEEAFDQYQNELAVLIARLVAQGRNVTLWGNSRMPDEEQDDFRVARAIRDRVDPLLRDQVQVLEEDSGLEEIRDAIRQQDVIVGTRLHSCILSLVEGVPAIALAYQPKAVGTYRLLGLSDFCRDVRETDAETLFSQIEQVLRDPEVFRERVQRAVSQAKGRIVDVYSQLLQA